MQPTMYVIAGPNGAGKSTLYQSRIKPTISAPFINADEIQKNELKKDDPQASYEAAQIAAKRREEHLKTGKSFVTESVFSHESKLDLVKEAKEAGFRVALYHVNVRDENVSVQRVAARVRAGGHPVPEEKIRARYHRNQEIIKQAAKLADYAFIYDNSREGTPPLASFTLQNGKLKEVHREVPTWARKLYADELRNVSPSRLNPAASSFAEAKQITHDIGGKEANLRVSKRNRMYAGKFVGESSLHLIQQTNDSSYVAHFKSNLRGDEAKLGSENAIVYDQRGRAQSYALEPDAERNAKLNYSANVKALAASADFDALNAKQLAAVSYARADVSKLGKDVVARFERAMTNPKKADALSLPPEMSKALISEAVAAKKSNSKEVKMSVAFKEMEREKALLKYPELAGAYAQIDVVNKKLDNEKLTEEQRSVVVNRYHDKLANSIQHGNVPKMQVQEKQKEVQVEKSSSATPNTSQDADLER